MAKYFYFHFLKELHIMTFTLLLSYNAYCIVFSIVFTRNIRSILKIKGSDLFKIEMFDIVKMSNPLKYIE